jgi:hypothetical protein
MAEDLVLGQPGRHQVGTLPLCDGSWIDLIKEATGWRQLCLETLEGRIPVPVQAFLPGLPRKTVL